MNRYPMKQFAIFIWIILHISTIQATDYYLSSAGNDSHTGTSETQAWASIKKLNSIIPSLRPGDRVLFERGGRFEGTIIIENILGNEANPITFGAFGTGENPIIDGSREVSGWTRDGNIWTSHCQDCPVDIDAIFINDESQPLGRYPNETNLNSSGGSGKNTLYDMGLTFENNFWKGSQVVISTQSWVCDAVRVFSQIGTTITLAERTSYDIAGDLDYFFQNHFNALDSEGEWAYNNTDKELYLYSNRDIPSSQVRMAYYGECISIRNGRYLNIENLRLWGSRSGSLKTAFSRHINLSNNSISNSSMIGIHIDHCENIIVDNNYIVNTLDIGIGSWDSNHCRFTNNRVENTATIPGRGQNGSARYTGIQISRGSDNLVEYNEVIQTGYNAISFYNQTNLLIKNNYINGYCTVLTDGGGIYTWHSTSPGNRILGNIVLNSRDDLGIYIDDESENIEIEGNTSAFNGVGIFIHNSRYIKVVSNLCYNNHGSQVLFARHGSTLLDYNLIKDNDTFTLGKRKQYSMRARFVNGENNVFENNCWADPFKKKLINSESSVWKTKVYTVQEWQSIGNLTDRSIPTTFEESGLSDTTGYVKFYVNHSKSVKTVELAGTYRDLDNQLYVGTVQLEPYSSIVLVAEEKN
jgi:parallel beta-helix repeat protein